LTKITLTTNSFQVFTVATYESGIELMTTCLTDTSPLPLRSIYCW